MELEIGSIIEGKVKNITSFGVFVEVEGGTVGLVHISEISNKYVENIRDHIGEGQIVKVKVLKSKSGKPEFSIKQALTPVRSDGENLFNYKSNNKSPIKKEFKKKSQTDDFEDMMSKFMKLSDDKLLDFNRKSDSGRGRPSRRGNNHSNI